MSNDNQLAAARALISLLRTRDHLELIGGVETAAREKKHAILNALVGHIVTHRRSEFASLADHVLPNMGMGETAFVQWLAFSEFGKAVQMLVVKPDTAYMDFVVRMNVANELAGTGPRTAAWNSEIEDNLKRIASAVLILLVSDYGRARFHPSSTTGEASALYDVTAMDRLRRFITSEISEREFFESNTLFTPLTFYKDIVKAGSLLIGIKYQG